MFANLFLLYSNSRLLLLLVGISSGIFDEFLWNSCRILEKFLRNSCAIFQRILAGINQSCIFLHLAEAKYSFMEVSAEGQRQKSCNIG